MVAKQTETVELATISGWHEALEELYARIAHHFARSEITQRVRRYLVGLLGRVERKNGWQLAEAIGETHPQGIQRLLNAAKWDAGAVRDDLRRYVVECLGDEMSGVLIVDETGFLKKGEKSVGVARQYTGTAGDTLNCQVGVFLAYSSKNGAAFVDRTLYLPKEWTEDKERGAEAGVPEEVGFANKLELAKRMLQRAFAAGVPARWVVADSFYGRSHGFRSWLERRGRPYAVMVPKTNAVRYQGRRKKTSGWPSFCPKRLGRRSRPEKETQVRDVCGSGPVWSFPWIEQRRCGAGYSSDVALKSRRTLPSTKPTARRGRLPANC